MHREPDQSRALRLIRPLPDFLDTETAGGFVLVVAIVAALVWANVAPRNYEETWSSVFTSRANYANPERRRFRWSQPSAE
jgi:Na+/H+ antiporter NhaA